MSHSFRYLNVPCVYHNKQRDRYICDHVVQNMETGEIQRKRSSFEFENDAKALRRSIINLWRQKTPNKLLQAAGISDGKAIQLLNLNNMLEKTNLLPAELEKVLQPYISGSAKNSISLEKAVEQYLDIKRTNWAAETYPAERTRLRRFYRTAKVEDLTHLNAEILLGFLQGETVGMRKKYLATLRSFVMFYANPLVPNQCYLPSNLWDFVIADLRRRGDPAIKPQDSRQSRPTCAHPLRSVLAVLSR